MIQPDGKIVVAGYAEADVLVMRFLPSGDRDPNFGPLGGYALHEWLSDNGENANAVMQGPNGSILVGGRANNADDWDFGLLRLTRSGRLDRNFSGDGKQTLNHGVDGQQVVMGLAAQGEKIIALGEMEDPDNSSNQMLMMARFKGRAASQTSLRVRKTTTRLKASGGVKPRHARKFVVVTLYKKKGGKFVKVRSKRDRLSSRSRYRVAFGRKNPGRCRVITTFPGDGDHAPSSAKRTFRC
jgi:uncharacterized delta-60 repeat protein